MGTVDYTDQNITKKINIINEMTGEIDENLTNIFLPVTNEILLAFSTSSNQA